MNFVWKEKSKKTMTFVEFMAPQIFFIKINTVTK